MKFSPYVKHLELHFLLERFYINKWTDLSVTLSKTDHFDCFNVNVNNDESSLFFCLSCFTQ